MSKNNWIAIILVILLISAIGSYAYILTTPTETPSGGTLTIGTPGHIESFHPKEGGQSALPFASICFDQAFEPFLTEGELVGQLVESWEREDDVTLVFHIREGVLFHNGEEMTAEDWKFTFEEYQIPGIPPAGQNDYCQHINRTEVVDRYTIKIVTNGPYGVIPDIFRNTPANLWILSKSAFETFGDDIKWNPVGTGPYKFVEYVEGEFVKYERFDDYWRGVPKLDYVIVKLVPDPDTLAMSLEAGEIDVALQAGSELIPILEANPNIEVFGDLIIPRSDFTAFNLRSWPTNDFRFRQAVHMAINWEEIIPVIMPNSDITQKYGFLHNSLATQLAPWAYGSDIENNFPNYDLDEAKRLIAELRAEQDIPPIRFVGMSPVLSRWTELFASILQQDLGLEVDVQLLEGPAVMPLMMDTTAWDMVAAGWGGGFPQGFMSAFYGSSGGIIPPAGAPPPGAPPPGAPPPGGPPPPGSGENFAGYNDPAVDQWLELANTQSALDDIAYYYQLVETQAVGELPYIWNLNPVSVCAYRSDLVGDIQPWPTGNSIYLVTADTNAYRK